LRYRSPHTHTPDSSRMAGMRSWRQWECSRREWRAISQQDALS
jgi:hypothetical protein